MAAAVRHFGHGITRNSRLDRKAEQKAKDWPHLLHVVRARSIMASSGAIMLSWPVAWGSERRCVSAGLDELLLLESAVLATSRPKSPLLASIPHACVASPGCGSLGGVCAGSPPPVPVCLRRSSGDAFQSSPTLTPSRKVPRAGTPSCCRVSLFSALRVLSETCSDPRVARAAVSPPVCRRTLRFDCSCTIHCRSCLFFSASCKYRVL